MKKIKIGILGYGNLGKGVELAVSRQEDMNLTGVYTRRNPRDIETIFSTTKVFSVNALRQKQDIDVLILCTGSATDLPVQTPEYAKMYHVVDSFDHHEQIPAHFKAVDEAAKAGAKLALISCGWDPGLFSLMRSLFAAIFPKENLYTFWGKGISQGHSDAIRRIKGVKDARQYTIPKESILKAVKVGASPSPSAIEMHQRECYVVPEEGADLDCIAREIKSMPDYFQGYDTNIYFISQEILQAEHCGFPHGGTVMLTGHTGQLQNELEKVIFQLELDSNPNFTAHVLVAYARAVYHMAEKAEVGCRTVLDIPVSALCQSMFGQI